MNSRTRSPKSMTESRRQREVHVRYGAMFRDIPHMDHVDSPNGFLVPSNHVPRPSKDATLSAFSQSACMRLGATRALVSLIDDCRTYVLAEATPDLYLRSNQSEDTCSGLWLGAVSVRRSWDVYDSLLNDNEEVVQFASGDASIIIVNDLVAHDDYAQRSYVTGAPHLRFYAGVPLISSKGAIVGTLSVWDNKPREGLSEKDILHLKDLADTIIEYMDLCMVKEQYKRGEKLTRALMSFAGGSSVMQPFENHSQRPLGENGAELPEEHSEQKPPALAKPRKTMNAENSIRPLHNRRDSLKTLQESILPTDSRSMFARAASVIQTSSDLDGMLILDASVAGLGNAHDDSSLSAEHSDETSSGFKSSSNDDDEESTSSPLHKKSSSTPSRKHCPVLGFATPCRSDFEGDAPPPKYENFFEKDLARLFRSYPAGKVIDLTDDGNVVTTTDESDVSNTGILNEMIPEHAVRRKPDSEGKARTAKALRDMLPEARSIAFVPLWDYERSRWFAGCLCWSDRPDRKLSQKVDLAYFKVFGHSIMADLSRLDAIASDQAKTSFVASISHELRSPLHGILGSLEFLKDTALDSFQVSMINSLGACGHTLLDTINHVLDYAKITSTRARKSSKRLKGTKGVHFSSKPLRKRRRDTHLSKHPAIDLERVTEETVEAVVSGQACTILQAEDWDADSDSDTTTSGTTTRGSASKRSGRYIILDIAHEEDWNYHLPPGSWRRVVMNLVGNALKYTKDGHIHVSLRSSPNGESFDERIIHLAIKDSGRGMSQKFLANRAFQPFEQENSQSAGTGLGLSIVQQIIDSVGGKISVTSDLAQGTEVRVRFALLKPEGPVVEQPQRNRYLDNLSQLKGRRICILHLAQNPEPDETSTAGTREALNRFTNAMSYTLSEHLKMQVIQTEAWEGHDADIVICPEPCFQYLALIRHRRTIDQRAPVTIFVAVDALEAATLRTDVRVKSRESVVEVMMQPCGPYKLANILDHCLNRFASPEENIWYSPAKEQSPLPSITRPFPLRPSASNYSGMTRITVLPYQPADDSIGDVSHMRGTSTNDTHPSDLSVNIPVPSSGADSLPKIPEFQPTVDAQHSITSSPDASKNDNYAEIDTTSMSAVRSPDLPLSGLSATSLPNRTKIYPSRVLITDDNPLNRKLLAAFLKKNKMMYKEAGNGEEAVQAYENASPVRFDVVLMDVSMPVMDGMSATRAIREYEQKNNLPRCHIIALTGLASASARLEAWSSGVDHYMTKPVNFKKLQAVLKDEVAKKLTNTEGGKQDLDAAAPSIKPASP